MPFPQDPGPNSILRAAQALGDLTEEVVFVGGAVIPLLATAPVLPGFRETDDVDFVVEVTSRVEFWQFEDALRARGFSNDQTPGAPLCRWRLGALVVDAMPTDPSVLGFSNPWYPHVLDAAWRFTFDGGPTVRVASAPTFLATKWAAFQDHGGGTDVYGSHDLEDILTVIDARSEAVREIREATQPVRTALVAATGALLNNARFMDAFPGLVERGREPVVLDRLRRIAAL